MLKNKTLFKHNRSYHRNDEMGVFSSAALDDARDKLQAEQYGHH